jgi:cytochrome c oxidase subunit 1
MVGWVSNPEHYYRSVTFHGVVMAYVLPTLVAMAFGYAVCELALKRPLVGLKWAWIGFWLVIAGVVLAAIPMATGYASVLYTFYPPMIAHATFYIGVVLVVVGSWVWVGLMHVNLRAWQRENPGAAIPLAMFGTLAGAYLWAWTSLGAAIEVLVLILPVALGLKSTIDAGSARVFFSWTLHAIVYFWLMPAYIAFYTIVPRAIGGRLYSDTMGRVAFVLFLVFSMPIGIHHLFGDPQVGAGFKFVHAAMTALVSVPTLLTVFTITGVGGDRRAAARRPGTLRVGEGAAVEGARDARGRVLLRDAGLRRGRRHHQHELPDERDDPQHAVGHRALPPHLRRRHRDHVLRDRLRPVAAARARRVVAREARAHPALAVVRGHDGAHHAVAPGGTPRHAAAHGVLRLLRTPRCSRRRGPSPRPRSAASCSSYRRCFSSTSSPPRAATWPSPRPTRSRAPCTPTIRSPPGLNGFALWIGMMVALTVVNYGFPIAQLASVKESSVPAIHMGRP